ncbi:MAG: hypothetical protein AAF841_12050 [Pseudomonadota bacterium]
MFTSQDPNRLSSELEVFEMPAALFESSIDGPRIAATNLRYSSGASPQSPHKFEPIGAHEHGLIALALDRCFSGHGIIHDTPLLGRCRKGNASLKMIPFLSDARVPRLLTLKIDLGTPRREAAPEPLRIVLSNAMMRLTQIAGGIEHLGARHAHQDAAYDALARACDSVSANLYDVEKSMYPTEGSVAFFATRSSKHDAKNNVEMICLALPNPPCAACGAENCPISHVAQSDLAHEPQGAGRHLPLHRADQAMGKALS